MIHRVSTDFDVNEKREFHRLLLKGEVPVRTNHFVFQSNIREVIESKAIYFWGCNR